MYGVPLQCFPLMVIAILSYSLMNLASSIGCIKYFRSDWGGESCFLTNLLKHYGIINRILFSYMHEQNGNDEHKIPHIIDIHWLDSF